MCVFQVLQSSKLLETKLKVEHNRIKRTQLVARQPVSCLQALQGFEFTMTKKQILLISQLLERNSSQDRRIVSPRLWLLGHSSTPYSCTSLALTFKTLLHLVISSDSSGGGYGHLLEPHNQSQGKLHRTVNTNALYFVFPIHLFSYRSQNDVKMSRVKIVSLGALDWLNWKIRMRPSFEHTNLIYCDFLTIFKWYLDL